MRILHKDNNNILCLTAKKKKKKQHQIKQSNDIKNIR